MALDRGWRQLVGGLLMKRWGITTTTAAPGLPAPNPAFGYVRMLAGFNGSDAATSFSDESGSALGAFTFAADAQLDTAQQKFGSASLLLDGTGDYVSLPDSSHYDIGSADDFQIEMWVRWAAGAGFAQPYTFMSHWTATGNQRQWLFFLDSDGLLKFVYSPDTITGTVAVSASWTPATQTWYHVAYSRVAGISRLFVGGTKLAESSVSNFDPANSVNSPLRIGGQESGGSIINLMNGWIDEARFTKIVLGGVSGQLYTASFIAPTSAFPRS